MEQIKKKSKGRKNLWSVHVFIMMGETSEVPFLRFLHLNVTRMYKEKGILHIWVNGKTEHHMHDCNRIASVQIRKYVDGIQWGKKNAKSS